MSWVERLRPASFRGVPFRARDETRSGGRRAQTHEYPLREIPWTEDLGRRATQWEVSGALYGDDYDLHRDALERALQAPGPGRLILPRIGERQAVCVDYTITERADEVGVARLRATFRPRGRNLHPRAVVDTQRQAEEDAGGLLERLGDVAERLLAFDGMPGWVSDAGIARAGDVLAGIRDASALVRGAGDAVSQLRAQVTRAQAELGTGGLASLGTDLSDLFRDLAALPGDAGRLFSAGESLLSLGAAWEDEPGSTPSVAAANANQEALRAQARAAALAVMASAAVSLTPESAGEAVALRERLVGRFDEQLAVTTDDELFGALVTLRASVAQDLRDRAAQLPRRVEVRVPATVPAVVLAQRIYGSAEREAEIVARNGVRHPLFVEGPTIEVLSGG